MAINIFNGSSQGKSKANKASSSSRAQATKGALVGASEASDSGGTAVAAKNTLSKVGNFVGKAAGFASKFLPGIGGTIAKGISNIFNDPEWWQSVPGDAVTLNVPLTPVELAPGRETYAVRSVFAEFISVGSNPEGVYANDYVMDVTDQMVTQYLMPQIRKVVNAVPLQDAKAYMKVLRVQATLYAIWRTLKRYDYMLKHGQTYVPNLNVSNFPVLQVDNAAWLQSTIGRLEEYLRANVRLPHTLCEYLAWRYGRVYKSCDSAKAGLILYNVLPINSSIEEMNSKISTLMTEISETSDTQKANTDLFNAYYDHDLMVEIADHTQFCFDRKEFCLRTNLDIHLSNTAVVPEPNNLVYIDSSLDNPTTFMASTVSTRGATPSGEVSVLFPVFKAAIWTLWQPPVQTTAERLEDEHIYVVYGGNDPVGGTAAQFMADKWIRCELTPAPLSNSAATVLDNIVKAAFCKTMDIYNKNLYVAMSVSPDNPVSLGNWDITSLSMDCGLVTDAVLGNEHVYAFANLVDIDRKVSTSYAQAEKMVARDTANLIEKLDVAALPSPAAGAAKA